MKIGVYVSLVSTRIPYGGAHKEFIGDENEDLQKCVRDAIMKCCIQLKVCICTLIFFLNISADPLRSALSFVSFTDNVRKDICLRLPICILTIK